MHVPRAIWVVIILLTIIGLMIAAQNSTVLVPQIGTYAVVDPRTIELSVSAAPCSWTRVTGVTETTSAIQVRVETLPCPLPGPGTDELAVRTFEIALGRDLGGRAVVDANGQAIPLR